MAFHNERGTGGLQSGQKGEEYCDKLPVTWKQDRGHREEADQTERRDEEEG